MVYTKHKKQKSTARHATVAHLLAEVVGANPRGAVSGVGVRDERHEDGIRRGRRDRREGATEGVTRRLGGSPRERRLEVLVVGYEHVGRRLK